MIKNGEVSEEDGGYNCIMPGYVVSLNNFVESLDINTYQTVNFDAFLPFGPAMAMGEGKLQIYDASYVWCPRIRKLTRK